MPVAERLERFLRASRQRPGRLAHVHRETVIDRPLEETFAFFADAANLETLTPSWLNFRILTPQPIPMREGAVIDYRIVLYGMPVPWRTRIDAWEPGVGFVDRQLLGPYLWWHHEHRFERVDGGTRVVDHVEYRPRARWLSGRIVRRDVERIFTFRQHKLREVFGTR